MTRRIRQREAGHCRDGRIRVTPHRVTQSTGGVKRRPSDLTPARCNPTPQTFHSKGFPGGVPETPKDPPRNTSGCLSSVPPGTHGWQRCLFFDPGSDAGVVVSSGPRRAFIHRVRRIARSKKERVRPNEPASHLRSSFKSRMSECQSDDAGANPADRTIFQETIHTWRAPARSRVSKTQPFGAAPNRRANQYVADKPKTRSGRQQSVY